MYTDGGCSGNQFDTNLGGWGCVLEFGENRKELCGGEPDTTNNKMELTAVISGFRALKRQGLTVDDLLVKFKAGVGKALDNDRMLLE